MEGPKNLDENLYLILSVTPNLQTKRLVRVLAALAAIEEVGLDVVASSEERAAGCVGRGVLAVGAGNTLGKRGVGNVKHDSDGERSEELFEGHVCSGGWS